MELSTPFCLEELPESAFPANNEVGSFEEALEVISGWLSGAPKRLYETRDGEPIVFDTIEKGKQSGWAYVNPKPDGWLITFGDARDGEKHTIFVKGESPALIQPAPVRPDTGKAEKAALKADTVWTAARPAGADHPYLVRKGVKPTDTLRELHRDELAGLIGYYPKVGDALLEGRILIAPVAIGNEISTLEFIDEQGRKSALAGGAKSSGYWATGTLPDTGRIVIAEGVATALSIAEALGEPVVAALSANNLEKVGRALQAPGRELVIAADLNRDGKPHEEAVKAAIALNARLCAPDASLGKGGDFNDLHVRDGLDAVRAVFLAPGVAVADETQGKDAWLREAMPRFSELQGSFRESRWLWPYWLPRGAFVVLAGAPGAGKTTVAVSIAAHVSTGSLPIGEFGKPHNVLFFTREDSYPATILPKLVAAKADLSRVRALEGLPDSKCGLVSFDPANDVEKLRGLLLALPDDERPALIIFDGIADAVKRDSHNNTDVRHALLPYVELARETDACVIGITHFSKNSKDKARSPMERVMGSVAFTAMARVVIAVRHNSNPKKENSPERAFVQIKNNLAGWQPVEGFKIEPAVVTIGGSTIQTSVAVWTGAVQGSAYEVLEERDDPDGNPGDEPEDDKAIALREACDFLQDALRNGARPAKEVTRESQDAGISRTTLHRARRALGVELSRSKPNGHYIWALPSTTESDGDGEDSSPTLDSNLTLDSKDSNPLGSSSPLGSSLSLGSSPTVVGQSSSSGKQGNSPSRKAGKTATDTSRTPARTMTPKAERGFEWYYGLLTSAWQYTGEKLRNGEPFVGRDGLARHLLKFKAVRSLSEAKAEMNPANKGRMIHTLLEAGIIAADPDGFRIVDPELAGSLAARQADRQAAQERAEAARRKVRASLRSGETVCLACGNVASQCACSRQPQDDNPTVEAATEPSLPGVGRTGDERRCKACGELMTFDPNDGWVCPSCEI